MNFNELLLKSVIRIPSFTESGGGTIQIKP
jgi:hypothetical protein